MHLIEVDVVIGLSTESSDSFVVVELILTPFEIIFSPIVLSNTNLRVSIEYGRRKEDELKRT